MKTLHDSTADEQASLWAARLDGGDLSSDQKKALAAWLAEQPSHRSLLSSYCQFSADLEQQLPLLEGIKEGPAERRHTAPTTALPHPWSRRPKLAAVALTAAAAVVFVFWFTRPSTQSVSLATPVAMRDTRTLVDGTRMELNAQTSVVVQIDGTERRVRLAGGQAFFAVAKDPDRPFIVETSAGSVRVTGTAFDVRAGGEHLEVTVAEGTVQVRPRVAGADATGPKILGANDSLAADADGVKIAHLDTAALNARLAWRNGFIVFAGNRLDNALARFSQYHGCRINASPEIAHLRVGGRYSLDDLNGFLVGLEDMLAVRVTRDLDGAIHVGPRLSR